MDKEMLKKKRWRAFFVAFGIAVIGAFLPMGIERVFDIDLAEPVRMIITVVCIAAAGISAGFIASGKPKPE